MSHEEIKNGLYQLGFDSGWVVSGDEITLWENSVPKPSPAAIANAAKLWATTLQAKADATAAAKASGVAKLAALGFTEAEIAAW